MFASLKSSPDKTALTRRGHGSLPFPIRTVKKVAELLPMVFIFAAFTRNVVSEVHWDISWLFCF